MRAQCTVDGCDRERKAAGMCSMHYRRMARNGDALLLQRAPKGSGNLPCSVDGCERKTQAKGMCDTHYVYWRRTGRTGKPHKPTVCIVDGCDRADMQARGMCNLHYSRWLNTGRTDTTRIVGDDTARFWQYVTAREPDECWEYQRRQGRGYGWAWWGGKSRSAHSVSYEIHKGEIPAGLVVCHSCDNPPCVNPAHLWLGTQTENMADMVAKGRHWRPSSTNSG